MNINYPTEDHFNYIRYIKNFCNLHKLSLLLYGSIKDGTASKFSDIDIIVQGNINELMLDNLIIGYDKIVMTNYTENPKGIFILNYSNLISVDLDIRDTILSRELENSLILSNFGWSIGNRKMRTNLQSKLLPYRPEWYKSLRLIHRCAIKHLCGKAETAKKLLFNVIKSTEKCCGYKIKNQNIEDILIESFYYFQNKYDIDTDVIIMFKRIFKLLKSSFWKPKNLKK